MKIFIAGIRTEMIEKETLVLHACLCTYCVHTRAHMHTHTHRENTFIEYTARGSGLGSNKGTTVYPASEFFFSIYLFILCLYVWGCLHMPRYVCGYQRTTSRDCFSSSTIWVQGDWIQVVRLDSKHFYLQCYLTCPLPVNV